MRPVSWIAVGTRRFPERIARRLRALNVAVWIGAAVSLITAVNFAVTDWSRYKWLVAINVFDAIVWASMPLLHRFGALAAPIALAATVYAANTVLAVLIGRDAGIHLWMMLAAPMAAIFLGLEQRLLVAATLLVGIAAIVGVHLFVPPVSSLVSVEAGLITSIHVTALVGGFATMAFAMIYAVRQIDRAEAALEKEYARSESLLANILPGPVAARLKGGQTVIADRVPEATVLFADLSGFTTWSSQASPDALISYLNRVFSAFDALTERHGLEKIKTIGDSYMAVAGLLRPQPDHAVRAAELALAMMAAMDEPQSVAGPMLKLRVGIASGPVVAGVIGTSKFAYDVWGDTVNLASRMESQGVPGRIQVAPASHALLQHEFEFEARAAINVRSLGPIAPWFLIGRRAEAMSG